MAIRPVFLACEGKPFFRTWNAEFQYNSGVSISQRQKNIQEIHGVFLRNFDGKKILEISSRSMQDGGKGLSALSLEKFVPSLQRSVQVENIFQAGKVFEYGGPFTDLLTAAPKDAKRDKRLKSSGRLIKFTFEGQDFPLEPKTVFYDFIYIQALLENPKIADTLLGYDAFTDIEFNPEKSMNCQARSAAIFVSLSRLGLLKEANNFETFSELFSSQARGGLSKAEKEETDPKPVYHFSIGDMIEHQKWGRGQIIAMDESSLEVKFDTAEKRELSTEWVATNCKYK